MGATCTPRTWSRPSWEHKPVLKRAARCPWESLICTFMHSSPTHLLHVCHFCRDPLAGPPHGGCTADRGAGLPPNKHGRLGGPRGGRGGSPMLTPAYTLGRGMVMNRGAGAGGEDRCLPARALGSLLWIHKPEQISFQTKKDIIWGEPILSSRSFALLSCQLRTFSVTCTVAIMSQRAGWTPR